MTLIHTFNGECTFSAPLAGSCKVNAFFKRRADAIEQPLYLAAKAVRTTGLTPIGQGEWITAASHNANHGRWVVQRYNAPERSFVKVMVKRKENEWGYKTRGVILMVREAADLIRLRIPLIDRPDANMTEGHFEGRFDILYPDRWPEFGIEMPEKFMEPFLDQFLADTDPDFADDPHERYFIQQTLERGDPLVIPKTVEIETVTGKKLDIVRASPRRLITLRNPRKK